MAAQTLHPSPAVEIVGSSPSLVRGEFSVLLCWWHMAPLVTNWVMNSSFYGGCRKQLVMPLSFS